MYVKIPPVKNKASFNNMNIVVNDQKTKNYFLERISTELKEVLPEDRFLTIDTEFIRENLEIPLLCLVQIASPKSSFVIDPLSIDISFLNEIFYDKNIPKIFHSARQDVEILAFHNIELENIYDTQIYEMLLNTQECISYRSIIKKYLNQQLEKNHALSDWSSRPLSSMQLEYAIDDVSYLRSVYKKQQYALSSVNRIGWLQDEMEQLSGKIMHKNETCDTSKINSDIYERLNTWVKNKAIEKNVNPEHIVKSSTIKSICKRGKAMIQKLKNSRYVKNQNTRDFLLFADQIVADTELLEKPQDRNALFHTLKIILEAVSIDNNIAQSLIATSNDLEKISRNSDAPSGKCFSGWRMEIFGKYVQSFLNEDLLICMKNSSVVIVASKSSPILPRV